MSEINPIYIVHVTTVLLSISGFVFRGVLHFNASAMVNRKWLKITPHINDTVLVASALMLLSQSGLNLLNTPWLLAKIIALLIYITLGLIAFRFGRTKRIRLMAWFGAILVFCYILTVAVTKNPLVIN